MLQRALLRRAPATVVVLGFALAAAASPDILTMPHDSRWGDDCGGPAGAVTPLSPTSFIAGLSGPDNVAGTSDDVTILVTAVGGSNNVKALATPCLSDWGSWTTVMSATRCAVLGMGPDAHWNTADDVVFVLDRLGSDDLVTPIPIGHLDAGDGHRPVALDPNTLLIASYGPDGIERTDDDVVALVTGVGTTNTVAYLPAPYVARYGKCRPVALSPKSFLLMSSGPDGNESTADDAAYVFTDVGRTNTRTTIATPFTFNYGPSAPVRLSATRAVLCATGPDGTASTADDVLYVLDRIGTKNVVRSIPVPSIARYGAGMPVAMDANTIVVASIGADLTQQTADDSICLVQNVAAKKPKITNYVVGFLGDDAGSRAVRLSSSSVAVVTAGPDGYFGNGDDRIAIIPKLGARPAPAAWKYVPVAGLSEGTDGRVVPVAQDAFLVVNGGPDGVLGSGNDDAVTLITGVFDQPEFFGLPTQGDHDSFRSAHTPRVLGRGRAAFASSGFDDAFESGQDDVFQIVSGLPDQVRLDVTRMDLLFDPAVPTKPARMTVKGKVHFEGPKPTSTADVTITVGNAAQTIPAASLKHSGPLYSYSDPAAKKGFVTKISVNSRTGAFQITGKGVGTGVESTLPGFVPIGIAFGDIQVVDPCIATSDATGLHFRQ